MLLYSIKRFASMLNPLHFNQKPALAKPITHTLTDYAEQLMITLLVVQCVQRGLVNLDETTGLLLPEYANPGILISFNQQTGVTILTTATKPITLSLILSHSIGAPLSTHSSSPTRSNYALTPTIRRATLPNPDSR